MAPGTPRATLRPQDRGAVLLTVLLVMLALLGMGVTALWLTGGNLQVGANVSLRQQALYVAEAGFEAVRNDLNQPAARNITTLLQGNTACGTFSAPCDDVPNAILNDQPNGVGAIYITSNGTRLRNIDYPPDTFGRTTGPTFMGR